LLDGSCVGYDSVSCSSSCQLSTEGCGGVSGGSCGDGFINIGEECDGVKFGSVDECSDFVDFVSGVLSCSSCRISTFGCECVGGGSCGDGVVDVGESCDGTNFDGIGEHCDGDLFGVVDECSDFDDFVSGVLRCSSCRLSMN